MEFRAYVQHTHTHTPSLSVCTVCTAGAMFSQHQRVCHGSALCFMSAAL